MQDSENSQSVNNKVGNYILGKTLGRGTFGKVKLALHTTTGEKVAIKILEKARIRSSADAERVSREIRILKLVNHPHIVKLYEIIESSKTIYLIMEFVPCGELFDYIVSKSKLPEDQAAHFYSQMLSALEYLHKQNIIHRDLKPENLLLDENNNIKIVDFGLSFLDSSDQFLKTSCGSPWYAAPETLLGKKYKGKTADYWSCGVVLFVMLCGFLPFEDPNSSVLYKKIMSGNYKCAKWVSLEAQDLIKQLLNVAPDARIDIEKTRLHVWFAKHSNNVVYNSVNYDDKDNENVFSSMRGFGVDSEFAKESLLTGKFNSHTATYFILLMKIQKEGQRTGKIGQRSSVGGRRKKSCGVEEEKGLNVSQQAQRVRIYAQDGGNRNVGVRKFRGTSIQFKNRIQIDAKSTLLSPVRTGGALEVA